MHGLDVGLFSTFAHKAYNPGSDDPPPQDFPWAMGLSDQQEQGFIGRKPRKGETDSVQASQRGINHGQSLNVCDMIAPGLTSRM